MICAFSSSGTLSIGIKKHTTHPKTIAEIKKTLCIAILNLYKHKYAIIEKIIKITPIV